MKNIYCLLLLIVGCFYAPEQQGLEEGARFSTASENFIYRNYSTVKDIAGGIEETVYAKGEVLMRELRVIGKIALNILIDQARICYKQKLDTVYRQPEMINIKHLTQSV